jgi:hypothetical protein
MPSSYFFISSSAMETSADMSASMDAPAAVIIVR